MLAAVTRFRRRVGAFIGGFEAGLANRRLKGFVPSRAHLNTLIAAAGLDITARARFLVRNNGYAANAIESWAGNVVGAGIKPSSLISDSVLKANVQKLWLDWTDDADAEGFTDFYGLQRRAAREVFIAGEVFFRFRPRRPEDGLVVPLQLQMLPSEMLPLNRNEVTPGGNVIRHGIEFDRIGRRVAYHFLRRHPGDITDPGLAGEVVRIPASEIVHVIDPVDAGQLRGVSRFAASIVKLFLLDQYDDAELDRKKVAAMHALFITTPAPAEPLDAVEGRDDNDERTIDLQPGQITMLEPGEEVQTSDPADSGQTYEPFQYRTLLQVSAALGLPYAYVSNDMLKANYSNSRLALLEFRRRIEAYQHAVMVWQLCRQVWAGWMDVAVLAGTLDVPVLEVNTKATIGLADAWLEGAAAAQIAEVHRKALTETIQNGVDVETRARDLLREQIAEQAAQSAKSANDLGAEADAQRRLNDAVLAGRLSTEQAQRQMQVEQALRPLLVAQSLAEGEAKATLGRVVDQLRGAYARLHGEQARAAAIQTLESQNDQIELLKKQIELAGTSESQRAIVIAQLQAEQQLRQKGIDLASAEGQAILANAGFIERLNQELARSQGAMQALQSMTDSAFNRFADLLAQGKTDWKSWADAGRAAIADINKEVLKLALLNPLKNFLFGTNLTTLDNVGGLLGDLFKGFRFHEGGVAGVGGMAGLVPAAVFRNAPRLHGGAFLSPNEVPAILQRGERVLSREETRRYGERVSFAQPVINVTIQTPSPTAFNASRAQVAADLARAVRTGMRGV